MVNPEQYQDILKKWVYPPPKDVVISWLPSHDDAGKGIVLIHVPLQTKSLWPFLITRVPDEQGRNRGILFGYSERRRSNAEPASLEELHSLIRDGARYDTLNQKLDVIQHTLRNIATKEELPVQTANAELDSRVGLILSELELGSASPTYVLGAVPMEKMTLPTLFESGEATVIKLLEDPPTLRNSGFNVHVGESARIVAGERRRVLRKNERTLNCWRDGTLVYACDGDYIFWGDFQRQNRIINQLCLIETVYLFANLTINVYEDAFPKPKGVLYRLEIRNMTKDGVNPGLIRGPLKNVMWTTDEMRATSGSKVIHLEVGHENTTAGAIAYKLISEFYAWMGLDAGAIPYKEKAGSEWVISPQEIRRMYP